MKMMMMMKILRQNLVSNLVTELDSDTQFSDTADISGPIRN